MQKIQTAMLHPNQFRVNEAWIAFKLNDWPILTETDGDLDCLALMDAASCFLLSSTFFPADTPEPSEMDARRLLSQGQAHKNELPKTLFIPENQTADILAIQAEHLGITVVLVPENQLLLIIGGARESFNEHFGGGPTN